MVKEYRAHTKQLDKYFKCRQAEDMGLIVRAFEHDGKIPGVVVGAYFECSSIIHQLATLVSKYEAIGIVSKTKSSFLDLPQAKAKRLGLIKMNFGLQFHRAWACL